MNSQRSIMFLAVLLSTALGFLSAHSASGRGAEFLENYKKGLAAVESENWSQADRLMRRAIAGRSEEARRLPKFLYVKPYLPQFYLGLALFEQGNCSAALDVWAVSERQGVIQKRPQFDQIRLARELCRERTQAVAQPSTRSAAPPPVVTTARSAPASTPEAAAREQRPVAPTPAPPPVRRVDPNASTATRFDASPHPRFQAPEVQASAGASGPPPEPLRGAVASFLDGSYGAVIEQLSVEVPSDAFAKAQSQLLLAASELALFFAGGEQDAERLERSRQHILDVRSVLPDLEPPERYFSPRFIDFFYGQRPEGRR